MILQRNTQSWIRCLRRTTAGFVVLGMTASTSVLAAPRTLAVPQPVVQINLSEYGYRAFSEAIAQSGLTVLSVHFAGEHHLLVTFASRKLLHRDPNQQEGDRDRVIHAVLFALPSGKAVAETDWRMHDGGIYLWPLTGGRFLLRVRDTLSLVSPLQAKQGEELNPQVVLPADGQILRSVDVTADGQLVAVQREAASLIGDDPDMPRSHIIDFGVFSLDGGALKQRGHATLQHPVHGPFNLFGFLNATQEGPDEWGFNMNGFLDGSRELAGVQSSCQPEAAFLSEGEFLVFACRGGDVRSMIGVLNVRGEVAWLGPGPSPAWPGMASAPNAERFALRNTISGQPAFGAMDEVTGVKSQQVSVYRTFTGEELLRVSTDTVTRSPQNFAISPDGLQFAIWQGTGVSVFPLPALTAKEVEMGKQSSNAVPPKLK